MTIDEYIKSHDEKDIINGIEFQLFGVNYDGQMNIEEKAAYEHGDIVEYFSFLERLQMAKEEIEEDTKGMTADQAKEWYKEWTEKGNQYYWGGMVWISTENIENEDCIYYGVRMD